MRYLSDTFSPMMMAAGGGFQGREISIDEAITLATKAVSVVGHAVTCEVLKALLGRPVEFDRQTITLAPGYEIVVVAPKFRADIAREFSREEVEKAGYRCFFITALSGKDS